MMWRKTLLLLLLACILLEVVSSAKIASKKNNPTIGRLGMHKRSIDDSNSSSSSSSSSSESAEENIAERDKLFNDFSKNYYKFVKSIEDKRKSVAAHFIRNKLISKVKSAAVEEIKVKLSTDFSDDDAFKNIKNSDDADLIRRYFSRTIQSISELIALLQKYSAEAMDEPNGEEVLIQEVLKQSDADEWLEKVHKRFEDFTKTFVEKVRDYLGHLTEVQKESEIKLVNWYQQCRAANGFETKVKLLFDFFTVSNPNLI